MGFEEATVHHVLGLLDRHSFKTLEHAVQQFKDHKQRFLESLFELKSLKSSAVGDCPIASGAEAPSSALGLQTRRRPLKPPVDATCKEEDIENHGGKQYVLRSRAPRKLSTVVPPQRMTRSRAKQSVPTTATACGVPSKTDFMVLEGDLVHARADGNPKSEQHQQTSFQLETSAGAAMSRLAEARAKGNPESGHQPQTSSQVVIAATERSASKVPLIYKETLTPLETKRSSDFDKETSRGAVPGVGSQCIGSIEHFKPFSLCLVEQIPTSGEGISGGRFNEAHLMGTGAAALVRSPTEGLSSPTIAECDLKGTIVADQSKRKQDKQSFFNAGDVPCPTKGRVGSHQLGPTAVKHAPQQSDFKADKPINQEHHGTDTHQFTLLGKRKLSVDAGFACCVDTDDHHVARNRNATSSSSTELEAFKFDTDEENFFPKSSKLFKSFSSLDNNLNAAHSSAENICHQASRFASREVNIYGGDDDRAVANIEFMKGSVEPGLKGLGDFVASEGPCGPALKASCRAGGNEANGTEIGSQDYTPGRVLKGIHEGTPESGYSFHVTAQEVHQTSEKIEVRIHTHTEMMNHDDRSICSKGQHNITLEITCTDKTPVSVTDISDVCHLTKLQPESSREMGSGTKSDLESVKGGQFHLISALKQHAARMETQAMEPCMCQFAEHEAYSLEALALPTEGLASETAVLDDLPQSERTAAKVMPSDSGGKPRVSKDDVISSPKGKLFQAVSKDCMPLSPGMRLSPALNNAQQMKESNLLFSASKSSRRVNVALLSSSELTPNPNMERKPSSISVISFRSTSPSEKRKSAADTALDCTDVGSQALHSPICDAGHPGPLMVSALEELDFRAHDEEMDNRTIDDTADGRMIFSMQAADSLYKGTPNSEPVEVCKQVRTSMHFALCDAGDPRLLTSSALGNFDFHAGHDDGTTNDGEYRRLFCSPQAGGSFHKVSPGHDNGNINDGDDGSLFCSLQAGGSIHKLRNSPDNVEEKPICPMELIVAPAIQLGCTSESAVVLTRASALENNIESPRQLSSATEANNSPELQHKLEGGACKTGMRSSSRPAYSKTSNDCGLTRKSSTSKNDNLFFSQASNFEDRKTKKSVSLGTNSAAHILLLTPTKHEEAIATKLSDSSKEDIMSSMMPALHSQVMKNERYWLEIDLKKSSSHTTDCGASPRPELDQKEKITSRNVSLDLPSPSVQKCDSSVRSPVYRETKKRAAYKSDDHDNISNTSSQMDCSESPSPNCRLEEGKSDQLLREHEGLTTEWDFTPKEDRSVHSGCIQVEEDVLRFNQLLAQGTVNSSRRKKARSPVDLSLESHKPFKKMKSSMNENDGQNVDQNLSRAFLPYGLPRPSFGESDSPSYGLVKNPYFFSPVQELRDTIGNSFQGSPCTKDLIKRLGFHSSQRKVKGKNKLCESYSGVSGSGREYLDTPHFRSARADLAGRNGTKSRGQKSDCQLHTHIEEEEKENQTPNPWLIDESCSVSGILLEKQETAKARNVLGYANQSLGSVESSHKRYNLAVNTSSFLDLVQQKQIPLPYPNGKREVRVKALEAAELARRQEERREYERRMRRLECNEAKSTESECFKDKTLQSCASTIAGKGVSDKVKRVAELKMKMAQEKARKQEEEQRRKREKEADFAYKKRKREDADRREREEKRKRVEELQRLRKEQEERQRLELDEKEHKRRELEGRERERKAQEEEARRQRRIEKEKGAERRRKQGQESKDAWFAEKQAERKRKEAMLQTRGHEEDHIAQHATGKKFSELSTDSLTVRTSAGWEVQSKNIVHMRSQTSGGGGGLSLPRLGSSVYYQVNAGKLSTSGIFDENGTHFSAKRVLNKASFKCEASKGLSLYYSTPLNVAYTPAQPAESGIQSYEISPYRSSSEDEDEDDRPKKPIPLWARKENLVPQIMWQQCIDPDEIFSSYKTCSLAEIFGTTGSRRCKDFNQRSTSGDWLEDHVTQKEELDYKKTMGYIQH